MTKVWIGAAFVVLAIGAYWFAAQDGKVAKTTKTNPETTAIVTITVPDTLSANAEIGKSVYDAKCAACHAPGGVGQVDMAPPLIHVIYEPSHHGDESFQRAVSNGVRAHHWKFGNMPPVEGLTRGDVAMIVAYLRELQRANGIR